MSVIGDAIRDHEERCNRNIDKRLVSWKWLLGVIACFIIALITTAWSLGTLTAETKTKVEQHEKRLTKIEDIYLDIKAIRNILEKK